MVNLDKDVLPAPPRTDPTGTTSLVTTCFTRCGRLACYRFAATVPNSPTDSHRLAHITRYVGDLIQRIDDTPKTADHTPQDPFETEIRMLRKAIGPALPLAMRYFDIPTPRSREDLDDLVATLKGGELQQRR